MASTGESREVRTQELLLLLQRQGLLLTPQQRLRNEELHCDVVQRAVAGRGGTPLEHGRAACSTTSSSPGSLRAAGRVPGGGVLCARKPTCGTSSSTSRRWCRHRDGPCTESSLSTPQRGSRGAFAHGDRQRHKRNEGHTLLLWLPLTCVLCGGCGGCGADVMYDTCLCRYAPTHATNSGGRTPGSKLPASPPHLPHPDGRGNPWPCTCVHGPKNSSRQSTNSPCGAAQHGHLPPALRPLPFNLNWK